MTITPIATAAILGIEARPAWVHVRLSAGTTPDLATPSGAGRETLTRVRAALEASSCLLPGGEYLVDVSPGGVSPGQGWLDLPVAVAALAAARQLPPGRLTTYMLAGELGIDGRIRPVPGVLLQAEVAKELGLAGIVVPRANAAEAAAVEGLDVRGANSLPEVVAFLRGDGELPAARDAPDPLPASSGPDLAEIKGQEHVKRAMEVAAAGGHGLLMIGPPGTGKTMLAQALPGILPPLSRAEALETTRIHSMAGVLAPDTGLLQARPLRNPHTTISDAGLIGGGHQPRPGEVSLAHNGVLFMDPFADFRRGIVDLLRAPMDEGSVTLLRAGRSVTYPARFMLVAAMTPCPCGHHGDSQVRCTCAPRAVQEYLGRIASPIRHRIDLHIEVPAVRYREIADRRAGEPSSAVQERVRRAREVQSARFAGRSDVPTNAQMGSRDLGEHCAVGEGVDALLRTAITRLGLSAGAYFRVLKIARTIADLDGGGNITTAHVSEAIQYRSLDRTGTGPE
jgi:magnesium chelatase family protein